MKINDWRQDYNQIRPHGAIGNRVPMDLLKPTDPPGRIGALLHKSLRHVRLSPMGQGASMRNDAESIHVPVPEYATGQTTIGR